MLAPLKLDDFLLVTDGLPKFRWLSLDSCRMNAEVVDINGDLESSAITVAVLIFRGSSLPRCRDMVGPRILTTVGLVGGDEKNTGVAICIGE